MSETDNGAKATPAALQEREYEFPYHYASALTPTFRTGFIDYWGLNYNQTIDFVLELLAAEAPERCIDIGCGDGRLSCEIRGRFPVMEVIGVDYSRQAIALARIMCSAARFEAVDITGPHELGRFPAGVLMEVFEHIPIQQAAAFAGSVAGLIEPGGLLLVTVPHRNKPLEYKHYQHFTLNSLNGYFEPFFKVERVNYIEKRGRFNRLINWLVANRHFALTSPRLLNLLYRAYKRRVFHCAREEHCARLAVSYRRKPGSP